ncbi:MAG: coenzyme F420-0:L-glutamate ligase [Candidatus Bathyarchaeota archaeon]|nr:coenzyme F420-0:L-glutamate ligase [Candidatus Bathyarchaeota archaeon]
MTKYRALAVKTGFWKPGENYLNRITAAIKTKVDDGDFLVISEKAISTALGRILDESTVQPSLNAKLLSRLWMRVAWGYFLGVLCRFGQRLQHRLREYPLETGSRHKQVALEHAGVLQSLMFGSEGGIDGSNLPYSYVSLPLSDASEVAEKIQRHVLRTLGKRVCVVIVDTDKTYTFSNFHFTPRPRPMKGIHFAPGFTTYIIGRTFRLKRSSTPLAVAGCRLQATEALKIANIADRVRGPGSGATVWDMAARFNVPVTDVSWEMLARLEHRPIVLVRLKQE